MTSPLSLSLQIKESDKRRRLKTEKQKKKEEEVERKKKKKKKERKKRRKKKMERSKFATFHSQEMLTSSLFEERKGKKEESLPIMRFRPNLGGSSPRRREVKESASERPGKLNRQMTRESQLTRQRGERNRLKRTENRETDTKR